jgi:hypothetical protein
MAKCVHHPGREAVLTINQRGYCPNCRAGIITARNHVDRHVQPQDCFVWYVGANNWQPIAGTGCAHWVAHQRGIRRGGANEECLEGYLYRVRTLVHGMTVVPLIDVRPYDVYVTPDMGHTGLVISVTPNPAPSGAPQITIRHDSSGQGGVVTNDFATYFHGRGTFYR